MKTLLFGLLLISSLALAQGAKESSPIVMSGHEVNGIDRGRLNLVEEDRAELSTMKAIEDRNSNWQRRMKETVEEISWW